MKKYLLLLFFSLGLLGFSQVQNCKFNYNVNVELGKPEQPWDAFAILSYDFSKLNLKKESVKIEVVGILDCWNNLDGSDLQETIVVIDSKSKNFKNKGTTNLVHQSLMAKCFKYRIVVKNDKCEEVSDWKFISYNF